MSKTTLFVILRRGNHPTEIQALKKRRTMATIEDGYAVVLLRGVFSVYFFLFAFFYSFCICLFFWPLLLLLLLLLLSLLLLLPFVVHITNEHFVCILFNGLGIPMPLPHSNSVLKNSMPLKRIAAITFCPIYCANASEMNDATGAC